MIAYKICRRCVMDTSDPRIIFDGNGYCNHCQNAISRIRQSPIGLKAGVRKIQLNNLIKEIKKINQRQKYDCIIGLSGGVDSSYIAYMVKKLGLRPLAVHLDNGWDSELAQKNIENIVKRLDIDLYTYVIDWEEFRDMQLSFLKASTPDSEIPTDHAIVAILFKMAFKYKVKHIILGTNLNTESIMPQAWSYGHSDWGYLRTLHNKFGKRKIKTFPYFNFFQTVLYYNNALDVSIVRLLDYLNYDKQKVKKILLEKISWRDYGGKHNESIYTRFYQGYILPTKAGYDKRRAHLSSLICSGQISRAQAIRELNKPLYEKSLLKEDKAYVLKKLKLKDKEFQQILDKPLKSFWDYSSYNNSKYYFYLRKIIENTIIKFYQFKHKIISYIFI